MIPMGYEYGSFFSYLAGGLVVLLWLVTIVVLAIRWLKRSFSQIKAMTTWDWAELSGWLIVISILSAHDSYLIFFR